MKLDKNKKYSWYKQTYRTAKGYLNPLLGEEIDDVVDEFRVEGKRPTDKTVLEYMREQIHEYIEVEQIDELEQTNPELAADYAQLPIFDYKFKTTSGVTYLYLYDAGVVGESLLFTEKHIRIFIGETK